MTDQKQATAWTPIPLPDAPPPKGAYTPAVRAGDFVFVSGQVPRDPRTGELAGDDFESQVRRTLANVDNALKEADASLRDVVSVTVYLTNTDDWGEFDRIYRDVMTPPYPTRTAVGVSLRGILVEVSAVAYVGGRA